MIRNNALILAVLLSGASAAMGEDITSTMKHFEIEPGSTYTYLPSPWVGIPACEPNSFRCDFGISGSLSVYTLDDRLLSFAHADLTLEGNESVQQTEDDYQIVRADLVEVLLKGSTFHQTDIGVFSRNRSGGTFEARIGDNEFALLGGINLTFADGDGYSFDVRASSPAPSGGVYSVRYRLSDTISPTFFEHGQIERRSTIEGEFDVIVVPDLDRVILRDRGLQLQDFEYVVGGEVVDPNSVPEDWRDLENATISEVEPLRYDLLTGPAPLHDVVVSSVVPAPLGPGAHYLTTLTLTKESDIEGLSIRSSVFDGDDFPDYIVQAPIERLTTGDFSDNRRLDVADINLLRQEISAPLGDLAFDLSNDGTVDVSDLQVWVQEFGPIPFGDSDLDGRFTSSDLIEVFTAGRYETGITASWEEGDWNGDLRFDSGDLVFLFQTRTGGCAFDDVDCNALMLHAVPEPSMLALAPIALLAAATAYRRR